MFDPASLILLAELPPEEIGRHTGRIVVYLLLLAGIIKCVKISRRPTTSAICVSSLTVFLCGWLMSALAGNHVESRFAQFLIFIALIVFWVTSIVLGIVGLIDYSRNKEEFTQGRKQAWWGIVLSSLGFLLVGAVFANEEAKRQASFVADVEQANSIPVEGEQVFEELNFRFAAPKGWVPLSAKALNPDACLTYLRRHPHCFFMVIAERLGIGPNLSSEALLEVAQANLRAGVPDAKIIRSYDGTVDGIRGICFEATGSVNGQRFQYLTWVGTHNGFAYQLATLTEQQNAGRLKSTATEIRSGFRLIDRQKIAHSANTVIVSKHRVPSFGYEIDLSDKGNWLQVDEDTSEVPAADLCVTQSDRNGGVSFAIVPIDRASPDVEDLTTFGCAMEGLFNVTTQREVEKKARKIKVRGLHGLEVNGTATIDGTGFGYVARFLPRDNYDYLAVGWWQSANEFGESRVRDLLQALKLFPSEGEPEHLSALNKQQIGILLNDIGVMWYQKGKWEPAKSYFAAALKYDKNETFFENVINAQIQQGKLASALVSLETARKEHPRSHGLLSAHAEVLAARGDTVEACTLYQELFATGYEDEDVLLNYLNLAVDAQQIDNSIAVLNIYLSQHPSVRVERWRATMFSHKGNHDKAISLIKGVIDEHGDEFENVYTLAEIYEMADRYSDAITVCDEMLQDDPENIVTLEMKGRCFFSLENYPQARDTFERVRDLSPLHESAQEYLRYISALMGKGNRAQITTPIDPVELPPDVKQMMAEVETRPLDSTEEEYDLTEVFRVTGISYEQNKHRRITTFRKIVINTPAGVDSVSTMTKKFSPLSERLFVNRLAVYDEDGLLVAEGALDDYYVLDDADDTEATDERRMHMPIPSLKPGYTVELVHTVEDLFEPDEFGHEKLFLIGLHPLRLGAAYFVGDLAKVAHSSSGMNESEVNSNFCLWSVKNPTIFEIESLQADFDDFVPWVQLADREASWEEIGNQYLDRIASKLVLEPEIQTLAEELTTNRSSLGEKMLALSRYVQKECTYKAIEFGVRSRIPNSATLVNKNGYGDCKDHSVLLMQLLRSVGVEADLALVNSSEAISVELPSLDQFDHMIVFVHGNSKGQRDLFLDTTQKNTVSSRSK